MSKPDGRRYQRIKLNLPANIIVNAVDEYDAELLNISPGDLAVLSDAKTTQGDAVVITIKGLDVIEGTVARLFPGGFAVSFKLSRRRRTMLTEKLMLKSNPDFIEHLGDRRESLRHRDGNTRTVCRLADGASLYVKILDRSVDGVAVEATRRPEIGANIHVGRRSGVVIRHTPRGFVVIFEQMQSNEDENDKPILRAV